MKSKTISIRLSQEQDEIVTQLADSQHISKAEVIRQCINDTKIVVVKGFDELLPMLAVLTSGVQNGDIPYGKITILRKAVDKLWQSLDLLTEAREI